MPRDQRQTQYIKEKIYNLAHFPNVVACVDGTHVRISTPSEHEWEFVNRKDDVLELEGVHDLETI